MIARFRRLPAFALLAALILWARPTCAQDDEPTEAPEATDAGTTEPAPEADADADAEAEADADADAEAEAEPEPDPDALPDGHTPDVTVEVAEGEVRTGDLVHVTITAVVPEGDDVGVPEQGFGPFELFDHDYSDEPTGDGHRRFTFEMDLLALEPGELELPALRLRVVTADGEVGSVRTEPRAIEVGSHLANEPDAEPRPPTQPVQVFEEDYTLAWVLGILGALLLMAIIGFFVGRWWRRRPKKAAPPPPPRPPWEVALEQLEAIRKQQTSLIAEGRQTELVDRISDVVREYLGHRYDFNGLESTSDEVIARLRKVKLRRISLADIQNLLADSDLVKFAKAVPDAEQCTRMREAAVAIVKGTTPSGTGKLLTPPPVTEGPKPPSAPRIVLKTGEVALPLSVRTLDEARTAIGSAVGSTVRDMADRDDFGGTIRVALSPELPTGEKTDAALREIHDELASELDSVSLGSGQRFTLIIEHFHSRRMDATEGGRVAVTVVDDDGTRVEHREPKDAPPAKKRRSRPAAAEAARPPETAPEATTAETAVEATAVEPTATPAPETTEVGAAPAAPAVAPSEEDRASEIEIAPAPGQLRVTGQAFPEALDRVLPVFFVNEPGLSPPLVRWVTGVPQPVAYRLETPEGPVLFATAALRGMRASRADLHDRALANLRRTVPAGFAPTDEPAWLDGGAAAILLLPELVPRGEAWIAYPDADGALVVMREGASTTEDELARLAADRGDAPLFDRPVRVTRHGFAPADWPEGVGDRRTDPGHHDPRGDA